MTINIVAVAITFAIIFLVLTVLYWTLPENGSRRLQGYFTMIGILSLMTGIITFFINQSATAKQEERNKITQGLSFIQNEVMGLNRYFDANKDLSTMHKQIDPTLQSLPDMPRTNETPYKEIFVADWIIQIAENLVTLAKSYNINWNTPNMQIWIQDLRQKFNSPIVKDRWHNVKNRSSADSINFVDNFVLA